MKEGTSKGRYSKGGFGLDQNLILLLSLAAFILAYYFGTVNDGVASVRFETLKNSSLVLPEEKITQLESLSEQADADADLIGQYAYLVDYGSGNMLRGDIHIDASSISRSISINNLSMFASADYEIVGSTAQYKNISGDRYLFSEHGTAIGHDSEHGTYLEIDGDMKLFVEQQYTQDNYKPLSKSLDISAIERLKRMSIWSLLQLVFGVIGVGILLYIFINIFRDQRSGSDAGTLPA